VYCPKAFPGDSEEGYEKTEQPNSRLGFQPIVFPVQAQSTNVVHIEGIYCETKEELFLPYIHFMSTFSWRVMSLQQDCELVSVLVPVFATQLPWPAGYRWGCGRATFLIYPCLNNVITCVVCIIASLEISCRRQYLSVFYPLSESKKQLYLLTIINSSI